MMEGVQTRILHCKMSNIASSGSPEEKQRLLTPNSKSNPDTNSTQTNSYGSIDSLELVTVHNNSNLTSGSGTGSGAHSSGSNGSKVGSTGSSPKSPKTPYQAYVSNEIEDELLAHLRSHEDYHSENAPMVNWIINLSLGVNIFLFIAKVVAFAVSGSLSIAASVVDSFLDLLVQLIIYIANEGKQAKEDNALYPAGKGRFEPVGIILCASLMMLAALELIMRSGEALYEGFIKNNVDGVTIDSASLAIIAGVIIIKSALWIYCKTKSHLSDTVATLSFDHRNDVLSNLVALLAIGFVRLSGKLWWTDSVGCILISAYIANNWFEMGAQKVNELVGRVADQEFIDQMKDFVNNYHPETLKLDLLRAYHFGSKYLVELEVLLPPEMSVREAHDISLALQQAVERMENVERAFVHVDYESRQIDEHDPHAVAMYELERIRRMKELQQQQQ